MSIGDEADVNRLTHRSELPVISITRPGVSETVWEECVGLQKGYNLSCPAMMARF